MGDARPDPDALLRRIRRAEKRDRAGRLKVFFGAAPGVGKTYAMLEAAQVQRASGRRRRDRLASRPTAGRRRRRCSRAASAFPRSEVELPRHHARGVRPRRRARAPARRCCSSTSWRTPNAPGSRHPKRWQDVRGAARGGHRRLHDAQRPAPRERQRRRGADHRRRGAGDGARPRARRARTRSSSSICRPTSCCERLREGKVYVPRPGRARPWRASSARGTSSRCASSRCAAPPSASTPSRRTTAAITRIETTWPTTERVLVCVGPTPTRPAGARRAAHGDAAAGGVDRRLGGEPRPAALSEPRARATWPGDLRLAEQLGAETATLSGDRRERGDPALRPRAQRHQDRGRQADASAGWRDRLRDVARRRASSARSGDIDVYVDLRRAEKAPPPRDAPAPTPGAIRRYGWAGRRGGHCTRCVLAAGRALRRAAEPGDDLPARRRVRRDRASGRGPVARPSPSVAGVRLLLRPAAPHLRRRRHAGTSSRSSSCWWSCLLVEHLATRVREPGRAWRGDASGAPRRSTP